MIVITVNELVSDSLRRFLACGLSMPAWKSLRHLSDACDKELKLFQEKQKEMTIKHGGTPRENGHIEFLDVDKAKAFAAEWKELMSMTIELPGDPIKLDDLQSGTLVPYDHVVLRAFFVG